MNCHNNSNDDSIRRVLERHPDIHLAVLFGSLAKGTARGDSDIDLAVGAAQPLDAGKKMQLIMELAEATGRPVDLVDFFTVGEPLLGQILAGGRRIVEVNSSYAKMVAKHLFEESDFMPYRRRMLQERRRAWIGL
ncbi:MAG: nucleotidyltransferase domain-containing protein [Sulfuricellaceae bacterium]